MDGYKSYTHTDHAVSLRIRKRSPRWEWPSIIGTLTSPLKKEVFSASHNKIYCL